MIQRLALLTCATLALLPETASAQLPPPRYLVDPTASTAAIGVPQELSPPVTDVLSATVRASESGGRVQATVAPIALAVPEYIPLISESFVQLRGDTGGRWGVGLGTSYNSAARPLIEMTPAQAIAIRDICYLTQLSSAESLRVTYENLRAAVVDADCIAQLATPGSGRTAPSAVASVSSGSDVHTLMLQASALQSLSDDKTFGATCTAPAEQLSNMNASALAISRAVQACQLPEHAALSLDNAFDMSFSVGATAQFDMFPFVDEPVPLVGTVPVDSSVTMLQGWSLTLTGALFVNSLTSIWVTASGSQRRASAAARAVDGTAAPLDGRLGASLQFARLIPFAGPDSTGFRPGLVLGFTVGATVCLSRTEVPCQDMIAGTALMPTPSFSDFQFVTPFIDLRINAKLQFRVAVALERYIIADDPMMEGDSAFVGDEILRASPSVSLTVSQWELPR